MLFKSNRNMRTRRRSLRTIERLGLGSAGSHSEGRAKFSEERNATFSSENSEGLWN